MKLARDALGLGLRPAFYAALRAPVCPVEFFEVIAENHLGPSSLARQYLDEAAARVPVIAHNVSLNVLGTDPLDETYLSTLADTVSRLDIPFVTDHLCWTGSGGLRHHDLLPAPLCADLVPYAAERIRLIQSRLGVPFGVENVASYLRWARDEMPEWEFVRRVVTEADCGMLLDINNVYVSSVNHGFDPVDYLKAVPWERVLYVHMAGHEVRPDGLRHDTHDRPVDNAVWALYREAWRRGGPFPTLLEWDDRMPTLEVAVQELQRAREWRS